MWSNALTKVCAFWCMDSQRVKGHVCVCVCVCVCVRAHISMSRMCVFVDPHLNVCPCACVHVRTHHPQIQGLSFHPFHQNGFQAIPGLVSRAACQQLRERMSQLVEEFDPSQSPASIFDTEEQVHSSLSSAVVLVARSFVSSSCS